MGIGTTSKRWLTFNGVGIVGAGVQLGVLALLTRQLGMRVEWATPLAVQAAVLHNFCLHQRVTWPEAAAEEGTGRRLLKFHAVNGVVSLVGNAAITIAFSAAGVNVLLANVM